MLLNRSASFTFGNGVLREQINEADCNSAEANEMNHKQLKLHHFGDQGREIDHSVKQQSTPTAKKNNR
jgi:hypothetical protein